MASRCSRIINRASIRSATKLNSQSAPSTTSFSSFSASTRSTSSPLRRFSISSRIPSELAGLQSMLPLHNAVATARMNSCLSSTLRSCRALSQGTLCCTSPDL
ncbi:hypothetical protein RND71_042727 [Anisodus tanguticus]|uniref:Protein NUCLEAR FUSION DEFECTIVE 6, chloroplastic/mitochondrial-like n=1 Tax=Anisodus tanguticus TaxID=243964 RepID=A0AAE1QR71_9SOLA|nr:hypothetical protein RND71_042727 [Anisodus tanguticus]